MDKNEFLENLQEQIEENMNILSDERCSNGICRNCEYMCLCIALENVLREISKLECEDDDE